MRTIPVAASSVLAELLTGPVREAEVLVAGARAAYLRVGDVVLAVVAQRAISPASAVLLPAGRRPDDLVPYGACVRLGHGVLQVLDAGTGTSLRVARWFAPAGPARGRQPDPSSVRAAREMLSRRTVPAQVAEIRRIGDEAGQHLLGPRPGDTGTALDRILGRGPGMTPSGDDVAAGLLLAARAVLDDDGTVDRLAEHVLRSAAFATTGVSRGMLADAAAGLCPPVVAAGLDAVMRPIEVSHPFEGRSTSGALQALLSVGHTSGGDLLSGALAVLERVTPALCFAGQEGAQR